jgi:hypothetical protein
MKLKIVLIILSGVYSFNLLAQGRESLYKSDYGKNIKWNPLSLSVGSLSLQYERFIDTDKSVCTFGYIADFAYGNEIFVAGIGVGYRSYFNDVFVKSFFAEPFIKYQYITIPSGGIAPGSSADINTISVGFTGGRKWIFGKHITTEIYLGPSYNLGKLDEGNGSVNLPDWLGPVNGIWVRGGLNVGWRY